jgi:hypothetical protein
MIEKSRAPRGDKKRSRDYAFASRLLFAGPRRGA